MLAVLAANDGVYPAAAPEPTVNQVLLAYLRHAQACYRGPDGQPTRAVDLLELAFRPVRQLFGTAPAAEFGPKAIKAVREAVVGQGLCRKSVNSRVGVIEPAWRWAVAEELLPPAAFLALAAVTGLRAGRAAAPDRRRTARP